MKANEADTRANLIDPVLKQAGWNIIEHSYIRREVICPGRILSGGKRGNSVDSDYVLVYHGKSPNNIGRAGRIVINKYRHIIFG